MGVHKFPARLGPTANAELLNFLGSLMDDYDEEVRCDASELTFVMPVGICALACVCHQLHSRGQTVFFDGVPPELDRFLERMDVFEHCYVAHENVCERHPREDSLVEVRRLDEPGHVPEAAQRLVQAMTGCLMQGLSDEEDPEGMRARPSEHLMIMLRYILVELLENALTHGRRAGYGNSSVWVAATYYPKTGDVRLAFVDDGCGFLATLRDHPDVRDAPSDLRAMQAAIRPFVSSNKGVGILDETSNQGIGLTITTDIAVESQGYLRITSGTASVRHDGTGERGHEHQCAWQGAIVEAKLSRNALLDVNLGGIASRYGTATKPKLRYG